MKKSRFSTNISLLSEMIQDRVIVVNECEIANMKPYPSYRMVPFSMTSNDP